MAGTLRPQHLALERSFTPMPHKANPHPTKYSRKPVREARRRGGRRRQWGGEGGAAEEVRLGVMGRGEG